MTTDLFLTRRSLGSQSSDRFAVDLAAAGGDLRLMRGRANLAQAIVNRLLTRRGELADLGHPDYGSRLYQLIGEPNTRRTLALADLYIRESLADEERVAEVAAIRVTPPAMRVDLRNVLEISISVRPAAELAEQELLTLSLTMNLEG